MGFNGENQGVSRSAFCIPILLLEVLEGIYFFFLFQLLETVLFPRFLVPFHLQSKQ